MKFKITSHNIIIHKILYTAAAQFGDVFLVYIFLVGHDHQILLSTKNENKKIPNQYHINIMVFIVAQLYKFTGCTFVWLVVWCLQLLPVLLLNYYSGASLRPLNISLCLHLYIIHLFILKYWPNTLTNWSKLSFWWSRERKLTNKCWFHLTDLPSTNNHLVNLMPIEWPLRNLPIKIFTVLWIISIPIHTFIFPMIDKTCTLSGIHTGC